MASGYDDNSAAAQAIRAAGYPPDVKQTLAGGVIDTLWKRNNTSFWEVTMCQWQKRLDPTYDTYGVPGLGGYNYQQRTAVSNVFANVAALQTTGKIKKPLVTVAGTMDALLPINRNARAYEAAVDASRKGNNDQRNAQYRLYEVQNGTHIESYAGVFQPPPPGIPGFQPLVLIQPHAQAAFDALVAHVESNAPLPPSQCIPDQRIDLGVAIAAGPLHQAVRAEPVVGTSDFRRRAPSGARFFFRSRGDDRRHPQRLRFCSSAVRPLRCTALGCDD